MTGAPTLKQILDVLIHQVRVGKLYLDIAKGLLSADPVVLQIALTFFNSTVSGNLELAQSISARLYDRSDRAITVKSLLFRAAREPLEFRKATETQLKEAILKSAARVIALQPAIDAIRKRRNKWLSHTDVRTVIEPKWLAENARLTIPDLESVFKETEEILLEMSYLFDGTLGELRYLGGDDYEVALDCLRKYRCEEIKDFERKFGTWSGQRPKNCP